MEVEVGAKEIRRRDFIGGETATKRRANLRIYVVDEPAVVVVWSGPPVRYVLLVVNRCVLQRSKFLTIVQFLESPFGVT